MRAGRVALVAALLAGGLALQLHFFGNYPQPVLFGDPAGYYKVGERFQEAWARWRGGEDARAVFESVRGAFHLAAVGAVFGVLDALRPQDWGFMQRVFGAFNTLAMLGAFLLGRRLGGSWAAGVAALALAAVYPTFSVQTGRLYPDPITGCLFVWAAWLYAEAVVRGSARWMAGAGALFGLALLVRAQLVVYMGVVLGAALAVTARAWVSRPERRRLVLAFVLACAPAAAAWGVITWAVGERDDVVQLGNATFKPLYPYGFWQFLETDGWIGPYRFKTEPYYKQMEAQGRRDPGLMRSRARQWAFTARYVAARPVESALLVLDNAYRLYDRPANDYKWDYPIPYPWQVALQRLVIVLAVAGAALFMAERPALAGVFLLPAALALLHGLVFPWPRYNVPVMPILLASAGAALVRLAAHAWAQIARLRSPAVMALAAGTGLLLGAAALFPAAPEPARAARWLGWLAVLAAPFLLVARTGGRRTGAAAAAGWTALALPFTAHAARDRLWHERVTAVGSGAAAAVEQEIVLAPEDAGALRAAAEAFLVMDLRVPRGDLARARLEIGAHVLPGSALVPTMPRLRESTATGGRDWRGYPQWWAVPFDPAWLPPGGEPLRIRLSSDGEPLRLGGDRFADQQRVYEGPSFGDWPNWVALKLEYDGDYRIPVRRPLESRSTRSFVVDARGRRSLVAFAHRIRLITLRNNAGWLAWRSATLPRSGQAALLFAAWAGHRGQAELRAGQAPPLALPLGPRQGFEVESGGVRLCHAYEGERGEKAYGSYAIKGDASRLAAPGAAVEARLSFRSGMSDVPMFFVIDRQRPLEQTRAALGACVPPAAAVVDGAAAILDATHNNYPEDTGRWAVDKVF